jgi:predicted secreted protein
MGRGEQHGLKSREKNYDIAGYYIFMDFGGHMHTTILFGKISLLALFLSFAILASCAMKPAVTVTDADNGTSVEIKSGDVLAVKLAAQLGTGFGWKVSTENKNLMLKGEPEQVSKNGQVPGGPDYQTFKFKAGEKGKTVLKLQYVEGWKKEANSLKEFAITVIVK